MSKISVTTIAGLTSGGDANKVKIESGDDLVVESGGIGIGTSTISTAVGGGVEIHRNGGSSFRIEDTTNSVTGELQVYSSGVNLVAQTNHPIIISPNNSEIARFTTAGLHLGGTGAANALDDYEEGTFTPTSGVGTLTAAEGVYTKVGNMVRIGMYIAMPTSSSSTSATINGLPFTCMNSNAARAGLTVSWNTNGQGNAGLDFLVGENTTGATFYIDGASRTYANLSADGIYIGGTYPVA